MNAADELGKQIDELQDNAKALLDACAMLREENTALKALNSSYKHQLSLAQAGQKDGRNV